MIRLSPDLSLALDPGSYRSGWSILDGREQLIEAGLLLPERQDLPSEIRIGQQCDSLRELLDQWRPGAVVIEWTSGKVNVNRHRGAGAGLAVHGAATGALWREVEAWRRSLPADLRGDVKVILVRENDWTHGTHKRDRIAAVASEYSSYDPNADGGGDIADSISLNQWLIREERVRAGEAAAERFTHRAVAEMRVESDRQSGAIVAGGPAR